MDLKSMLNDSASQQPGPPRIHTQHTPRSSYDARIDQTPGSDSSLARPTPFGPPLQTSHSESWAQGGGYFVTQSPHLNASASASTPSVGPHSAYAQSPGPYAQVHTPRDSIPPSHALHPHNASFVSPSPSHHSSTPGLVQHRAYSNQSSYQHHHSHPRLQSPPAPQANGLPAALSGGRQSSPASHYQAQPATPLGPPIHYPKASPHSAVRPASQGGYDLSHLRRSSHSSISSAISQHNHYPQPQPQVPEPIRRESRQRAFSYDSRERSISVSPKTIPKPTPQRELSTSSSDQSRPSLPPQPSSTMSQPPAPSPDAIRREELVASVPQNSLKRDASHLSASPAPRPPQKRRRGEIPIWAQCARKKPLRFVDNSRNAHLIRGDGGRPERGPQNGTANANNNVGGLASGVVPVAQKAGKEIKTISDKKPLDSISKRICDWIIQILGDAVAPQGSAFEIEAKIGLLVDSDTGQRTSLPVETEAVITREALRGATRFHNSMNVDQHRKLNEWLNSQVHRNLEARRHNPEVDEVFYNHPKENDEFFELSAEGKALLDPELLRWINNSSNRSRRNEVRVRRSTNTQTGDVTAQIIKTRIADKDITNPGSLFDYRVSISLEAAWDGSVAHLVPVQETRGRNKNRMSYRHMMYQVDLTQVSHGDESSKIEHELEVEIAQAALQNELDALRKGGPTKYYEIVEGLINNVRVLCKVSEQG